MAYDPGLVARVADAIAQIGERAIRQRNVFGGRGFLAGSSTFVIVWDEDLIVKVPRREYEIVLAMPGVRPFAPDGEKPMSSWIVVAGETVADDPELVEWVRRGLRGVR